MLVAASLVALAVGVGIGYGIRDTSKKTKVVVASPAPTSATGALPRRPAGVPRPSATPASFRIGDKASFQSGASIQVFSYEPNVVPTHSPAPTTVGMSYGAIDVEFCAGRVAARYADTGFKAKMADTRKYGPTTSAKEPDLGAGVLPPASGCKRGYVTLQVPQGQQPVAIVWRYGTWRPTSWSMT